MLEVRNLVKTYKTTKSKTKDRVTALNKVSITFPETGLVFLLGKSGSGKSTLLNAIGGLDTFDSGEIIIKGKSSKDFSQSDFDSYRNTFIGFIFQEYNVLEEFTVAKNLGMALELQGKKATKEEVNRLLEQVEMLDFAKRKPNQLSGGQKQRVAIARALIKNPEIIMADEPTGALDSNTGKAVMETLKNLSKEKLVIIVSHDREFAEIYGDRIIELKDGKVISDVTKKEVEPERTESGVSIIEDKIIHIKKGTALTAEDVQKITQTISSQSQATDVIISLDDKSNDQMKKISSITDDGNREVFTHTQPEDIKTKEHNPKDFKLIKSRLHFKDAFKMGASALKSKVAKLVFTIILSFLSFAMFGLVDTLAAFNRPDAVYTTIEMTGDKQISLLKETKGEYSNVSQPFTDKDIAKLSEKFNGITFQPVVNRGIQFGNGGYSSGMKLFIKDLEDSSNHPAYNPNSSGMIDITKEKLDKLGFTLIGHLPVDNGRCCELHTRQITTHNGVKVNSIYDDCNPFGVMAGDFGEIANLLQHESQLADQSTINNFNYLAELFAVFMDNFNTPTDNSEYIPAISNEALVNYTDFFDEAMHIYNNSFVNFTKSINTNISQSAVIGANHPYTMTFGSGINPSTINHQKIIANLFGFESVAEFMGYAQEIADTYTEYRTTFVDDTPTISPLNNGCFYTSNKSFIFPIAIKNGLTSSILTYVIVDTDGNVSIWINDIATAMSATNFNSNQDTTTTINNEFYCKNPLFIVSVPKTQICISKHLYNCYKENNSEEITGEQDFLQNHNLCNLENQYMGGSSNYNYKIVGIIDNHDDLSEFYNVEEEQFNTMNGYMLQQKIRSVLDYGYTSMIYTTKSHYNTFLDKTLNVQGHFHFDEVEYTRNISLNYLSIGNKAEEHYYNNLDNYSYDWFNERYTTANGSPLYTKTSEYQLADDEVILHSEFLYYINYNYDFDNFLENGLTLKLRASNDYTAPVVKTLKVVGYSNNYSDFIVNDNVKNELTENQYYLYYEDRTDYLYTSIDKSYIQTPESRFKEYYQFYSNIYYYDGIKYEGQYEGEINLTGNQIILPFDYLMHNGWSNWEEAQEDAIDIVKNGYSITLKESYDEESKTICTFQVVGLTTGSNMYISEECYNNNIKDRISGYDYVIATLTDSDSTNKAFIKTCEKFNSDDIKYTIQNGSTSILDSWGGMFETLTSILIWVALGFAVFASLMLMSFISTSISYKKREIGILRALGARGSDVFGIFFLESLIIALINFVLAFTTTAIGAFFINRAIIVELGIELALLTVSIRQFALILGVSVLAAFIASILPVSKISRKKPIDAINNR